MKLLAACLLLCLGASLAAPSPAPPACSTPEQFEGKMSSTVGMVPVSGGNWNQGFLSEATIHCDFKNSKIAVMQELNFGDFKLKQQVVSDLAKKKMYIINLASKQCFIYPIPTNDAVCPGCQPFDNVKPLGTRKMGWEKDTLEVRVYETEVDQPPMIIKNYMTSSCLPVATQFTGIFNNVKMVQGQVFSDLVKGIKDCSVFNIPDYCLTQGTPFEASMEALNHVIAGHLALRSMYV